MNVGVALSVEMVQNHILTAIALKGWLLMLRLVEPAPLYKAAILAAVPEMQAIGEWEISPDAFEARFEDMLRELAAWPT